MGTILGIKLSKPLSFLSQPYPFYYRGKNLVFITVAIFLLAMAFNYLFQPFNVYVPEHKMDYFWISIIHSFTPIVIILVLLPFLRNPNRDEKWNVGKEMVLLATFLLLIGMVQFLIRDIIYDNPDNWSWKYFFEEIKNTFLAGTLLLSILISSNFNRLNRQNIKRAIALDIEKKRIKEPVGSSNLFIKTHLKGDDFDLNVNGFLLAKAEGNYVEIYVKNKTTTDKFLKRITIKDLESQLIQLPYIVKTHRSYLVNLHCIEKITGNAQGYQLKLKDLDTPAFVSRNRIPIFEKSLKGV